MNEFQGKLDQLAASFLPSPAQAFLPSQAPAGSPASEVPLGPVGGISGGLALSHQQAEREHRLNLLMLDLQARERGMAERQQILFRQQLGVTWASSLKWIVVGGVIALALLKILPMLRDRKRTW